MGTCLNISKWCLLSPWWPTATPPAWLATRSTSTGPSLIIHFLTHKDFIMVILIILKQYQYICMYLLYLMQANACICVQREVIEEFTQRTPHGSHCKWILLVLLFIIIFLFLCTSVCTHYKPLIQFEWLHIGLYEQICTALPVTSTSLMHAHCNLQPMKTVAVRCWKVKRIKTYCFLTSAKTPLVCNPSEKSFWCTRNEATGSPTTAVLPAYCVHNCSKTNVCILG